jgi:hypothetical protein
MSPIVTFWFRKASHAASRDFESVSRLQRSVVFKHPSQRWRARQTPGHASGAEIFGFFAFCRSENSSLCSVKDFGRLPLCCSGADPSPAPLRPQGRKMATSKEKETLLGHQRTRGIRDGVSWGRESGRNDLLVRAGEIAWVELPDADWRGAKCRDPSTQPHVPAVVRLSVGMTRE